MAYVKQTFVDDETVLSAEHLEHIEDGIKELENSIKNISVTSTTIENALGYTPANQTEVEYLSEKVDDSMETFLISITESDDGVLRPDKTFEEITETFAEGKVIFLTYADALYAFDGIDETDKEVLFYRVNWSSQTPYKFYYKKITLDYSGDNATYSYNSYEINPNIDNDLSESSDNPVKNKAVTAKINSLSKKIAEQQEQIQNRSTESAKVVKLESHYQEDVSFQVGQGLSEIACPLVVGENYQLVISYKVDAEETEIINEVFTAEALEIEGIELGTTFANDKISFISVYDEYIEMNNGMYVVIAFGEGADEIWQSITATLNVTVQKATKIIEQLEEEKADKSNWTPNMIIGTDANGNMVAKSVDFYVPKKGTDYWTDADQESIVQQVITALGTPVFGKVDEENNIVLTGELVEGTYTLKYEDAEGNVIDIGTFNTSEEETVNYVTAVYAPQRVGGTDYSVYLSDTDGTCYVTICQTTGTALLCSDSGLTVPTTYYPMKVPSGKTKVKVSLPNMSQSLYMRVMRLTLDNGVYTRNGSVTEWTTLGNYECSFEETEYILVTFRNEAYGDITNTSNGYIWSGLSVEWE